MSKENSKLTSGNLEFKHWSKTREEFLTVQQEKAEKRCQIHYADLFRHLNENEILVLIFSLVNINLNYFDLVSIMHEKSRLQEQMWLPNSQFLFGTYEKNSEYG